jgi:hypothetical protein
MFQILTSYGILVTFYTYFSGLEFRLNNNIIYIFFSIGHIHYGTYHQIYFIFLVGDEQGLGSHGLYIFKIPDGPGLVKPALNANSFSPPAKEN